jgi:hypothetical protein
MELDRSAFADIIHRHPNILLNISRVLVERQRRSLRWLSPRGRDVFILLMIGRGTEAIAQELVELCRQACPQEVTVVDLTDALELAKVALPHRTAAAVITVLDQMIDASPPVISVCHADQPDLALLVRYMDRLTLLGTASDARAVAASCSGLGHPVEVFLIGPRGSSAEGDRAQARGTAATAAISAGSPGTSRGPSSASRSAPVAPRVSPTSARSACWRGRAMSLTTSPAAASAA